MPLQAITAIGRDRPGIVAALTRELLALGGNLADSQMSIMRGHFAVMLICELPEAVGDDQLTAALDRVRAELGLDVVRASPLTGDAPERPSPTHVLSVYGADHPGIVAAVSAVLAAAGVNVTGLETHLVGSDAAPIYAMLLELELGGAEPAALEDSLREAEGAEGLEISLREIESEAL